MGFISTARSRIYSRKGSNTLASFFSILLVIAGLAACGSTPASTSSNGQSSGTKPNVVIGYIDNGAEPEVIAVVQDLFSKRMHANVQVKYFDSGPASLAALASGSLQFMTGIGNPPTVSAISHGVPLQVVWSQELYTKDEGLVVRKGSGINSIKDLKGKSVALVLGSTSQFAFNATLAKAGVDPSTVHLLNMAPPAMHSAWSNHSIDAVYVWDPVLDALSRDNGTILSTDDDVKQDAPVYSLSITNSTWAKSNPDLVKEFILAQNDAVTFYNQHPDEAVQLIAKRESISVDLTKTELAGYKIYTLQDQLSADCLGQGASISSSLVTKSLSSAARYLHSSGALVSVPTDFSQNVDPSYAESALKDSK